MVCELQIAAKIGLPQTAWVLADDGLAEAAPDAAAIKSARIQVFAAFVQLAEKVVASADHNLLQICRGPVVAGRMIGADAN